jgi:hypothetical protein
MLGLAIVLFGATGVLFVVLAERGADVRLWPTGIYVSGGPVYLLAAMSFAFVALAISQVVRGMTLGPRELVITDAWIEAPKSPWARETIRIKRAAVRSYDESNMMGTRIVAIQTKKRKLALSNRTVGEDGYDAVLRWLRG